MADNPLELDTANAVIAGGGALGAALANQLVRRWPSISVRLLARRAPDRGLVAVAGPGEGGRLAELDASLAA